MSTEKWIKYSMHEMPLLNYRWRMKYTKRQLRKKLKTTKAKFKIKISIATLTMIIYRPKFTY